MNVNDLIEELKKYDGETKVMRIDSFNYVEVFEGTEEFLRNSETFVRVY